MSGSFRHRCVEVAVLRLRVLTSFGTGPCSRRGRCHRRCSQQRRHRFPDNPSRSWLPDRQRGRVAGWPRCEQVWRRPRHRLGCGNEGPGRSASCAGMHAGLLPRPPGIHSGRQRAAGWRRSRRAARLRLRHRVQAWDAVDWEGVLLVHLPRLRGADGVWHPQVRAPVLACAATDDCSTVLGIAGPGWVARWETIVAGAAAEAAEDGDE
jgi:hypothetical protein